MPIHPATLEVGDFSARLVKSLRNLLFFYIIFHRLQPVKSNIVKIITSSSVTILMSYFLLNQLNNFFNQSVGKNIIIFLFCVHFIRTLFKHFYFICSYKNCKLAKHNRPLFCIIVTNIY